MIITFLSPTTADPMGGVLSILEFAGAMRRHGHVVHVVHVDFLGRGIRGLHEVGWTNLEPGLEHHFAGAFDATSLPASDAVVCFDGHLPGPEAGRPLMLVQAHRILPDDIEQQIYGAPCPKLCTSSWLREVAVTAGVPPEQAFHLPYGIDHRKYAILTSIGARPRRVAMLYSEHPLKDATLGVEALRRVSDRVDGVEVVLFGVGPRPAGVPDSMAYVQTPPQDVLVDDIYNGSQIFVSPALREGFGLAAVEAMACGAALVTTDNGGSRDYAYDGETAAVCAPGDVGALSAAIERVLVDDDLRHRIASRGHAFVQRFEWDRSAVLLTDVIERYLADPALLSQPGGDLSRLGAADTQTGGIV